MAERFSSSVSVASSEERTITDVPARLKWMMSESWNSKLRTGLEVCHDDTAFFAPSHVRLPLKRAWNVKEIPNEGQLLGAWGQR
jgi:hypothetical protein